MSEVPVISLTRETADRAEFDAALLASFKQFGFAVLSDHGIDQAVIDDALAAARAFFALPRETKMTAHRPGTAGARGYTPFGIETAKGARAADLKEFWHIGRELPAGHRYEKLMPGNVDAPEAAGTEDWRGRTYALYQALDDAGRRILRALARGLGLPETFWDEAVREGDSILRLLHYPPVEAPAQGMRAGAHADINAITLLLGAEEDGLEILPRGRSKHEADAWLKISPPPGALVVNIGDMIARQSNDLLPSTVHRVVNPSPERTGRSRYSTPFFLHFAPDYLIEPLPGAVTAKRPNRYGPPITARAYLEERLKEIKLA
ncbi:MAG: 2-oxoglutarate and iron-dependent oxygenase domain-containing protein [Maricaulaceae bacterium]|jgi:isopenicillin N synthase-like dioxygenase